MSYIPNTEFKLSQFGKLEIAERTPIVELKSIYGLSALRDIVTVAGSGTVTHAGAGLASEFTVATTASGTDSAKLESAEHGRYEPGASGEVGIGVRLASGTLTGNQIARWGMFDDNDGIYFGLDATGFFVGYRKGGSDTIVRQGSFNVDDFDGTGPSGLTLDLTDGNIYQIDFSWYGYGTLEYVIVTADANGRQKPYVIHRFNPTGTTSIGNPNLPIAAQIANAGTAAAQTLYVGGRQYSILGRFDPNRRANGHFRSAAATGITTTFVPVLSFRRKTNFQAVSARVEGFDAIASTNMYWQMRVNGSLTGASWGTPANTTAAETAFEVDTSATAITGGEILNPGGVLGASSPARPTVAAQSSLGIDIPDTQPVTLCVRTVTGSGASLDALVVRWREEW